MSVCRPTVGFNPPTPPTIPTLVWVSISKEKVSFTSVSIVGLGLLLASSRRYLPGGVRDRETQIVLLADSDLWTNLRVLSFHRWRPAHRPYDPSTPAMTSRRPRDHGLRRCAMDGCSAIAKSCYAAGTNTTLLQQLLLLPRAEVVGMSWFRSAFASTIPDLRSTKRHGQRQSVLIVSRRHK